MINFFRKKRKKLAVDNNVTKYTRYAIGEILLVVIGILIALQLNNWNEARKEYKIETSILQELLSDLNSDRKSLSEDIELNKRAKRSNQLIQDHLKMNGAYHDSLDFHFGSIQYNTQFTLNTGGFENLKSRGFEIISNDSLRKRIIALHDTWYDYLFIIGERNNVVNFEQFLPEYKLYFTNFNNNFLENTVSFTPINYSELVGNTEFLQFISYQKFINEGTVQVLDNTIIRIEELISNIQEELNSRL